MADDARTDPETLWPLALPFTLLATWVVPRCPKDEPGPKIRVRGCLSREGYESTWPRTWDMDGWKEGWVAEGMDE